MNAKSTQHTASSFQVKGNIHSGIFGIIDISHSHFRRLFVHRADSLLWYSIYKFDFSIRWTFLHFSSSGFCIGTRFSHYFFSFFSFLSYISICSLVINNDREREREKNEAEKKELNFGALNWFSVIIMQSFEDFDCFRIGNKYYNSRYATIRWFIFRSLCVIRLTCYETIFSTEKLFRFALKLQSCSRMNLQIFLRRQTKHKNQFRKENQQKMYPQIGENAENVRKIAQIAVNMIFGISLEMALQWSRLCQVPSTRILLASSLFTCFASNVDLLRIYFNIVYFCMEMNENDAQMSCASTTDNTCTCTVYMEHSSFSHTLKKPTEHSNTVKRLQRTSVEYLIEHLLHRFMFHFIGSSYISSFRSSVKSIPHRLSGNLNHRFQLNV